MKRIYIFCEGQTEETFVREVLYAHFCALNVFVTPIVLRTGKQGKGGVTSYKNMKEQINKKCREDQASFVTTFIDFYGLYKVTDFPDIERIKSQPTQEKILLAERSLGQDINMANFIPNIIMHEFEGLLFSNPDAFSYFVDSVDVIESIRNIRKSFENPEMINDGISTAPSKRIISLCDKYEKVLYGSLIALEIGLSNIRRECPHFDSWIKRLESL